MALSTDNYLMRLSHLITKPACLVDCVADKASLRPDHADQGLTDRPCVQAHLELEGRDLLDGFHCEPNAVWNIAAQIARHVGSSHCLHPVEAILSRQGVHSLVKLCLNISLEACEAERGVEARLIVSNGDEDYCGIMQARAFHF